MKKRVYLAIFALTFGLCAGCGNKEADSDISGTEDTVFQTEEPLELSGTGNIDLSEENKDSGGENADSSEENNGSGGSVSVKIYPYGSIPEREAGPDIKGRGNEPFPGSLSGVCPCKDRGSIIGYHPLCAFCSALNPGNRHFGGAAILSGDAKGRRTVESKAG